MGFDLTKMTPELYESIINARKIIDENKKNIALRLIDIKSEGDIEELAKIKDSYESFETIFNNLDKILKQFEF